MHIIFLNINVLCFHIFRHILVVVVSVYAFKLIYGLQKTSSTLILKH